MKFIICLFSFCIWWSTTQAHRMINQFNGIGEPKSPTAINNVIPDDRWFLQKLDHFNSSDTRTWRQRYQVNEDHYKNNGPIFLMIGGEGPISSRWMHSGAWIEYAKDFNALCFQLEHRYYGNSHPTKDTSTKNLIYLSSDQALADLAEFIVNIQIKYKIPSSAKWVSIGGSYAGSLSAWLRMKYPHLIHAAISTSSPLLAKVNFKEYFEVVANSLATYNSECVLQIKKANKIINLLLKSKYGTKIIENKFKLCNNLNRHNKKDVATLYQVLADNFAGIVQYNKNNRYYKNPEHASVTLEYLCDIMVNKSLPTPLDRYAAVNSKLLSITNTSCIDHIYSEMVDFYSNITWDNNEAAVGRLWTYQTCTEFGFYQTSDQVNHVFGHSFPIEYFIDLCTDIFGKSYNSMLLSESIKRTNMVYGELNIRVGRVIFVHGTVDPWHALGITQTRTKNNIAIFINGTAHCANMYPSSETDLPQLKEARVTIRAYLKKWLIEDDFVNSTAIP